MTTSAIQTLITGTLTTFGASVLVILTSVISIGVAYLIFRWGWNRIMIEFMNRTGEPEDRF